MEEENIAPTTVQYIQLIQSVSTESHACTPYWNIVYWRDFLPIPTGSVVVPMYVFGAISSSFILCPILCTTFYSMIHSDLITSSQALADVAGQFFLKKNTNNYFEYVIFIFMYMSNIICSSK